MEKNSPKYLIIMLSLVVLLIASMYVMKNIFHVEAYPPRKRIQTVSTLNPPRRTPPGEAQATKTTEPEDPQSTKDTAVVSVPESESEPKQILSEEEYGNPEKYFEQLLADYNLTIEEKLDGKPNRQDLIIRYYPHSGDSYRIQALRDLRLYIHERSTNENSNYVESNSIFYGDSVSTEDIHLIAYLLVTNGMSLKQIIPSKFHDDWKSRSVEIGNDESVNDELVLSLEEIKAFKNEFYSQIP